jgi:hypothetical protein
MYAVADSVCPVPNDGRPMRFDWAAGRGGRKWQRWWRRSVRRRVALRRALQYVRRYYNYTNPYEAHYWSVRWLEDDEVQLHLFTVRLGGEGRFGTPRPTYVRVDWNTGSEGVLCEATGEGNSFHFMVVGRFAKQKMRRRRQYQSDYDNQCWYADPYYRWTQAQLQQERDG